MQAVQERRVAKVSSEARDAVAAGRTVFVPRLAKPDSTWAAQIEAIEAAGWRLEHWALSLNTWFVTVAYPVFRRTEG